MNRRTRLLSYLLLLPLVAGCYPLVPMPGIQATPTNTPCPPAPTPERFMPAEAAQVEGRLSGLDVRVSAIGFSNCPGEPAVEVAWFAVNVTVEDRSDREALGQIAGRIITAVVDWPDVWTSIYFTEPGAQQWEGISFTVREALALRNQGLSGAALFEALEEMR